MSINVKQVNFDNREGQTSYLIEYDGQQLNRSEQNLQWLREQLIRQNPLTLIPVLPFADPEASKDKLELLHKCGYYTDAYTRHWLLGNLATVLSFGFIVPQTTSEMSNVVRRRLQIERFLQRLMAKQDVFRSSTVQYFLSSNMTSLTPSRPSVRQRIASVTQVVLQRGLQSYPTFAPTQSFVINTREASEYNTRKQYITDLEDNLTTFIEAFYKLMERTDALARSQHQVTHSLVHEVFSGFQEVDQVFGQLKDNEVKSMVQAMVMTVDPVLEYLVSIDSVKGLMNSGIDQLAVYYNATCASDAAHDQLLRLQTDAKDSTDAEAEYNKQLLNSNIQKETYDKQKSLITKELVHFEKDKGQDLQYMMRQFAENSVRYHNQSIDILRKLL